MITWRKKLEKLSTGIGKDKTYFSFTYFNFFKI
jgi:hypothetical protein